MSSTLDLAKQLIAQRSLTPNDAGCQKILAQHLEQLGFTIQHLRFGDVDNLWATHGTGHPVFVFAGHTDVVPPGPEDQWTSPPFQPEIREGFLFGRGAADMKSSLAAMIIATKNFLKKNPQHLGTIAFLITSDEEGVATNGTAKVIEHLQQQNISLDYCVIGEASSDQQLGDTIKVGRRGSLNGVLTIFGKQGHIAYPHLAENPVHKSFAALKELSEMIWDKGNDYFPPTSFQISNIHAGTGADNVIPGELSITFNFRYSSAVTADHLQKQVNEILTKHSLNYKIDWRLSGYPFFTAEDKLTQAAQKAIQKITQLKPILSTTGGTSDGRFIAPTGCQVVEIGPCNESIHKINECVNVADLEKLTEIYHAILQELML